MSKKDDEIKRLKSNLQRELDMTAGLHDEKADLEVIVKKGAKKIKDLEEVKTALSETAHQLAGDIEALNENHNKMMAESLKKIQELTDHRQLMVINVNVAGVPDLDKCLADAVSLVEKRLVELKIKDDYVILAVPHTMAIDIPR